MLSRIIYTCSVAISQFVYYCQLIGAIILRQVTGFDLFSLQNFRELWTWPCAVDLRDCYCTLGLLTQLQDPHFDPKLRLWFVWIFFSPCVIVGFMRAVPQFPNTCWQVELQIAIRCVWCPVTDQGPTQSLDKTKSTPSRLM